MLHFVWGSLSISIPSNTRGILGQACVNIFDFEYGNVERAVVRTDRECWWIVLLVSVGLGDDKLLVLISRWCYRDTGGARIPQDDFNCSTLSFFGTRIVTFSLNCQCVPARRDIII